MSSKAVLLLVALVLAGGVGAVGICLAGVDVEADAAMVIRKRLEIDGCTEVWRGFLFSLVEVEGGMGRKR